MTNLTSYPYFSMDISKILAEFKMPGVDTDVIVAAHRKNIEAVTAANKLAIEGMQAVGRRQAEILRTTFEEAGILLTQSLIPGSPETKVAQQAELVKTAFEKALGNMKELAEMVTKSNNEAAEIISKRVNEGLGELTASLAKVSKK